MKNYLIKKFIEKLPEFNGKCRVRILSKENILEFFELLKNNPKAKKIRVYCHDPFVALNYKYVVKTRCIEYTKEYGISLCYASAFRVRGCGQRIVIQN